METTQPGSTHEELPGRLRRCIDAIRARGCKITPQRRAILELFCQAPLHLTAPQIHARLEDAEPGLSRATVYNNLELFERLGLLRRVLSEDGQTYYDNNLEAHHHAVCRRCGEIFDVHIPASAIEALITSSELIDGADGAQAFSLEGARIWLSGSCPGCDQG